MPKGRKAIDGRGNRGRTNVEPSRDFGGAERPGLNEMLHCFKVGRVDGQLASEMLLEFSAELNERPQLQTLRPDGLASRRGIFGLRLHDPQFIDSLASLASNQSI